LTPPKKSQNPGSQNFKKSNIDEVYRICMAPPRGLSRGKTEPPDYILMFSSANVPGITYKINFKVFCPPVLEKHIFESSTKLLLEAGSVS